MRVVWTELAFEQLDSAMAFIARDRPDTAVAWLELMLDAGEGLSELPDRRKLTGNDIPQR